MTLTSGKTRFFLASAAFCFAFLFIFFQWWSGLPFSEGSPIEWADASLTFIAAALLTVIFSLIGVAGGRLSVYGLVALAAVWLGLAADAVGIDNVELPAIVPDDAGTLLTWVITAAAVLPRLTDARLTVTARSMFGMGFLLQSFAFIADLGDGSVFHLPRLGANVVHDVGESFETLCLSAYLSGLLLVLLSMRSLVPASSAPLPWAVAQSTVGRSLTILWENAALGLWRLSHPGASFADYYADSIVRKLDKGKPHRTLGKQLWSKGSLFTSTSSRKDQFEQEGEKLFKMLLGFEITPQSKVIEYGCGSLRIGQHFVKYLEAGHYWGLDITARFFTDGLELLPRQLLATKLPSLHVIDTKTLELARLAEADFIISIAVMKHVPHNEIDVYWRNIAGLMKPAATAIVGCELSHNYRRTGGKNWSHSEDFIRETIGCHAAGRPVRIIYVGGEHNFAGGVFRKATIVVEPRAAE